MKIFIKEMNKTRLKKTDFKSFTLPLSHREPLKTVIGSRLDSVDL